MLGTSVIGAIVGAMALRNQLTARVDTALATQAVEHIDQTNESDLNFITRLAQRFDAVATVKKACCCSCPLPAPPKPCIPWGYGGFTTRLEIERNAAATLPETDPVETDSE